MNSCGCRPYSIMVCMVIIIVFFLECTVRQDAIDRGQNYCIGIMPEALSMFWMDFLFLLLSKESMQEFQEWFSGIKAAAKESSDRTGDSKVLEAKLHDLQV